MQDFFELKGLRPIEAVVALKRAEVVFFDFDGTICPTDCVDDLAEYLGCFELTNQCSNDAMNGLMTLEDNLLMLSTIIHPTVQELVDYLKQKQFSLNVGVIEFMTALRAQGKDIFVVSGGVDVLLAPVCKMLGIPTDHLICNRFIVDETGTCSSFDYNQLTSHNHGKSIVIQSIMDQYDYKGCVMIGDGIIDLETKPVVDAFIGYYGAFYRPIVQEGADLSVSSFLDLTFLLS